MENNAELQFKKMIETPVNRLIITLAIPTIISMLVTTIYNMADTYFVGTIGTSATGATGVVFGLMAILQAFGFMFGHGAGSNISRNLGSKNIDEARIFASTSFYFSILVGIIIGLLGFVFLTPLMRILGSTPTILPYAKTYAIYILIAGPAMTSSCVMNNILRYEGKAFFAMIGLTTGGMLNIFGDALLVQVFHMGIAGAGLSTAISQYIGFAILLHPFLTNKTQSKFHIKHVSYDMKVIANIVKTGLPSLTRQGLNSISTMLLNTTAGFYGDAAVAAISITNRIINFLFCVAMGVGQGLQPVSAFNYGAKRYDRVRQAFLFSLYFGMICMSVLGIVGYVNVNRFIQFFRDDIQVINIGRVALKAQCLSLWLMPFTMFGNMLFQSIGVSKTATLLSALRSGVVLIPCILIFSQTLGLFGLQISQAVSELITAICTLPFIILFFKQLSVLIVQSKNNPSL